MSGIFVAQSNKMLSPTFDRQRYSACDGGRSLSSSRDASLDVCTRGRKRAGWLAGDGGMRTACSLHISLPRTKNLFVPVGFFSTLQRPSSFSLFSPQEPRSLHVRDTAARSCTRRGGCGACCARLASRNSRGDCNGKIRASSALHIFGLRHKDPQPLVPITSPRSTGCGESVMTVFYGPF